MEKKTAPKIGFVHTGVPIGMMLKKMMSESMPDIPNFHIVDDSLIQDLLQAEKFTPSILKRLSAQISMAKEAGADIIMVTCSSIAPGVDFAKKLVDIPVMKIDEPMAELAVESANTIGVLATAKTTLVPSVDLINQVAKKKGKPVKVKSKLISEAFDFFLQGDMENHDRLVRKAGLELAQQSDVLVLAQASMSHLAAEIEKASGTKTLTSPQIAMDALKKMVSEY
ncbi:MAG: aspartate/glutamate racemase family protein [Desulfobacterales bacterium]